MNYQRFLEIREKYNYSNHVFSVPGSGEREVHVLWMYPDILHMHGGRGDMMALARYALALDIPLSIKKVKGLRDEIDFAWADIIILEGCDLNVVRDVNKALGAHKADFQNFVDRGGTILAIGNSGALVAEKTLFLNGETSEGLGLLNMEMKERATIFGDDLWFKTADGHEIIGNEIQRLEAELGEGQEPWGQVIYGRGNTGTGQEGAIKGRVIFTNCLGPILVKNPSLACRLMGNVLGYEPELDPEEIALENQAIEDYKIFMKSKMEKQ